MKNRDHNPEETWRNERFSFRFMDISDEQLDLLKELCPDTRGDDPRLAKLKRVSGRVASIPLSEGRDYSWIKSFIDEEQLAVGSYDVFMSLVTESDSEIIETPSFILQLVHKTGAKLLFSFTVVPS